jgi:hypothetical protein
MSWQPKFTAEQWSIVEQVALLRVGIPGDKEVARALGISIHSVRYMAKKVRVPKMALERSADISTMPEITPASTDVHGSDRIHDASR